MRAGLRRRHGALLRERPRLPHRRGQRRTHPRLGRGGELRRILVLPPHARQPDEAEPRGPHRGPVPQLRRAHRDEPGREMRALPGAAAQRRVRLGARGDHAGEGVAAAPHAAARHRANPRKRPRLQPPGSRRRDLRDLLAQSRRRARRPRRCAAQSLRARVVRRLRRDARRQHAAQAARRLLRERRRDHRPAAR